MASIGPSYFTTAVTQTTNYPVNWVNPTNALTNDGTYATITVTTTSGVGNTLVYKLADLGLPTGATVTGLTVAIRARQSTTNQEITGGFFNGNLSSPTYYGTAPTAKWCTATNTWQTLTFGGISNVWGLTGTQLTEAWWNGGTGFFRCWGDDLVGVDDVINFDYIQMTVYYTPAGGGPVQYSVITNGL